jgi:hypothetical protein
VIRILWLVLCGCLFGLLSVASARADSVESALMPGRVIEGHADLEDTCKNCHVRFNKAGQATLCLDCHKEVAKDVQLRRGYHGQMEKDRDCRECHTEHKGRGADIAPLNEKKFDHNLTDFALKGGHTSPKVGCHDCHKPKTKYRDARMDCVACHKKDDKHKGSLGSACANCHVERNWKDVRFDHSKTKFSLTGGHREVACKTCHKDPSFKNTPTACVACHKKDDKHKTRFGDKCASCHLDKDWKTLSFDHTRDTKYPLNGKHLLTKCTACHSGFIYVEKPATRCVSCHKKDDTHKTRFGDKCQSCHVEKDWKVIKFEHDRDTRYALRGQHKTAKCTSCHNGVLYQDKTQTTCYACHTKDDKHKGQEGKKCESCHNESSWKKTLFDHGQSRFPLLGKHIDVPCKKCHLSATFRDANSKCNACHAKDDTHKRTLGTECGQCHNARDWKAWDFDHNRRSAFKLDGGHIGLACETCHKRPVSGKVSLGGSCSSCHDGDDVHNGSFGRQCERCHVTSSFKKIKSGSGR